MQVSECKMAVDLFVNDFGMYLGIDSSSVVTVHTADELHGVQVRCYYGKFNTSPIPNILSMNPLFMGNWDCALNSND